ncbi:MAG: anthranilate synthase subunit II [Bacteroides sp. SM23_62_1]|nr:MAG: anthranilate synthase subunit II [Bacteroides sp. SM23_62_1]
MKIAVIDNYDSFTYNLVHALKQISRQQVVVFRNDRVNNEELRIFDKILLSPGPGIPDEAGMLKSIIRRWAPEKSILGVCLGHQAIAEVFGGKLINIRKVFHGVATKIKILKSDDHLFLELPEFLEGGRYHSWIVSSKDLPDCFEITAEAEDGEIMAISHKEYDLKGLQFHPESVLTTLGEKIISNWLNY